MYSHVCRIFSLKLCYSIILVILCTSKQAISEEQRYIRDSIFVPLRSGQSIKHRIVHKGLVSGSPLILIAQNEDESYSLVRTQQGIEGWLQTQYLSEQPSARSQVKNLSNKNATLIDKNAELKQALSKLGIQYSAAEKSITALGESQQTSDQELAQIKTISANAIRLNSDNQVLLEKNQQLQHQVNRLDIVNQRLSDKLANNDYLNGCFAVLIGVFITLLVPRLWPSKKSEWT